MNVFPKRTVVATLMARSTQMGGHKNTSANIGEY